MDEPVERRAVYTDAPYVRAWIDQHNAQVADQGICAQFESFLAGLPWAGSHIDWRLVPFETIELPIEVDAETLKRCADTKWGRHGRLLIMYNGDEPGIFCDVATGIKDLDLLFSAAPGTRFICGARTAGRGVEPVFDDFAEFNGFSVLTYARTQGSA